MHYAILPLLLCVALPLLAQPREVAAQSDSIVNLSNAVLPTLPVSRFTEIVGSSAELKSVDAEQNIKIETNPVVLEEVQIEFSAYDTEQPTDYSEDTSAGNSEDDLYCLAAVIWQEAGSLECSDRLQLMVASVVMNHVDNPNLPNSIRGVLERDGAYGTMSWTGVSLPSPENEFETDAIERCYANARRVLEGERWVPPNVIYQAGFTQGSGIYDYVEGVYFCYE